MKKTRVASFAMLVLLVVACAPARADILLSFTPVSQNVALGGQASVVVSISGLGDLSSPSLGTFDLNLFFDPAVLAYSGVTFGDPVLGDQLDLFGLGSITDVVSSSGVVNLFELSLDPAAALDFLQAGSFTLFTLTFDTLALGSSPLSLGINALGDSNGDPLSATVESGNISVVPEPATMVLLGSGLLALVSRRLRR